MILEITTHSGRNDEVEVENFNIQAIHEQTNDQSLNTIVIGDKLYSRIDIKYIGPKID